MAVLRDPQDEIYEVAISPDQCWLAAAGAESAVYLYDLRRTAMPLARAPGARAARHPAGVVGAGVPGTLSLWPGQSSGSVATGVPLLRHRVAMMLPSPGTSPGEEGEGVAGPPAGSSTAAGARQSPQLPVPLKTALLRHTLTSARAAPAELQPQGQGRGSGGGEGQGPLRASASLGLQQPGASVLKAGSLHVRGSRGLHHALAGLPSVRKTGRLSISGMPMPGAAGDEPSCERSSACRSSSTARSSAQPRGSSMARGSSSGLASAGVATLAAVRARALLHQQQAASAAAATPASAHGTPPASSAAPPTRSSSSSGLDGSALGQSSMGLGLGQLASVIMAVKRRLLRHDAHDCASAGLPADASAGARAAAAAAAAPFQHATQPQGGTGAYYETLASKGLQLVPKEAAVGLPHAAAALLGSSYGAGGASGAMPGVIVLGVEQSPSSRGRAAWGAALPGHDAQAALCRGQGGMQGEDAGALEGEGARKAEGRSTGIEESSYTRQVSGAWHCLMCTAHAARLR